MTYKWIKRLILWIPTITIAVWEYARHTVLLPYISMELGNVLAAVLVFILTITILRYLFAKMEEMQENLNEARSLKAVMQEREKLAKELHDGISQSLFMLSVKLDQLERAKSEAERLERIDKLREKVRYVYDDVRLAISNLRTEPAPAELPWSQSIFEMIELFQHDAGIQVQLDWRLSEEHVTLKEKIELFACLREALLNVQKHAEATSVWISGQSTPTNFQCIVRDNGRGFSGNPFEMKGKFGLQLMKERAMGMGWRMEVSCASGFTVVALQKDKGDFV